MNPWEMDWGQGAQSAQISPQGDLPWQRDWSGFEQGSIMAPGGMDAAFRAMPQMSNNPALVAEGERRAAPKGGVWNNATAGLNDAIYTIAGAPVDAARWVLNQAGAQARAISGAPVQEIPASSPGGSQSIASFGEQLGINDPAKVTANTPGEQIARAAGAGVGYAIAPEAALLGLGRAGVITDRALNAAAPFIGRSAAAGDVAANAFIGGASGAGAEVAGDMLPERYRPLGEVAGGLLAGGVAAGATAIPRAAASGMRAVGDYLAPLTTAGQERTAAREISGSATNPYAVREALDAGSGQIVPGSAPTTGQLTGDMGLLSRERLVANQYPDEFNPRRADQNAARRTALDGIQPQAGSENVVAALRQNLADIDAATAVAVEGATVEARTKASGIGGLGTPEAYGAEMRGFVQPRIDQAREGAQQAAQSIGGAGRPTEYGTAARDALRTAEDAARTQERALWKAVDPDGTLALASGETRKAAQEIVKGVPRAAKPIEGEERGIFAAALNLPKVAPFSEMTALRSRISTAMRLELKENGQTATYARLSQLRGKVEADIEGAVSAKVAQEADAVASGAMREEDTFAAWLGQGIQGFYERRAAEAGMGENAGAVGGGYSASRTRGASSIPGGKSAGGREPGATPGDQGVQSPGLTPNFDAEAAARLKAASDATKARAQTYGGGQVGQVLRREGSSGPYALREDAAVPARFFRPGPQGADTVAAYRAAVGDDAALIHLQDYAASELRRIASRPDGTLDPAKVSGWLRQHTEALRAFPDLARKIGSAKRASELLDEAAMFPDGTLNAEVASRVFAPGPKGYEAATRFIDGVGEPRARAVVQDYALSTLRAAAERPDGTLDPAKVSKWRERHADALRAFPEIDLILADPLKASEAIELAAINRKQALDSYQTGITARLMGLEDPTDIARVVGGVFSRQDAAQQMTTLRRQIGANPDGQEGLKKAVADYITARFISNTEAGTSEQALIKSDAFQTFVRQNIAALRQAGFRDREINVLRSISADLQRANRSVTAARIPGQSNTAQDTRSLLSSIAAGARAAAPGTGGGVAGFSVGGPIGALVGLWGANVVSALRRAGLEKVDDIIKDAMLNPERARTLLERYPEKPTRRDQMRIIDRYKRALPATVGASQE